MTINEAKRIAMKKLRDDGESATLHAYKVFPNHFAFFVTSSPELDEAEVGNSMLFVDKKHGITTWRSIRQIGPAFVMAKTINM